MTLHALSEYIKYRWRAKTRHGIHSPFVYSFIENVLRDKKLHTENKRDIGIKVARVPEKYLVLTSSIMSYYNKPNTHFRGKPAFLLQDAQDCKNLLKEIPLNSSHIVIVTNLHKTHLSSAMWENIYKDPQVTLSLDLYNIGVLFFRQEFKEKQHFILKY